MTLVQRIVLTGVAGLTIGLALGAAGSVLARPGQRTAADSAGASNGRDSAITTVEIVAAEDSAGAQVQGLPADGLIIGTGFGESLSADGSAYETRDRLVSIFSTMESRDAGRVIALLEDDVASDILSRLTDRKVAQILANMSEQRAAELMRILISGVE